MTEWRAGFKLGHEDLFLPPRLTSQPSPIYAHIRPGFFAIASVDEVRAVPVCGATPTLDNSGGDRGRGWIGP